VLTAKPIRTQQPELDKAATRAFAEHVATVSTLLLLPAGL